MLLIGSNFLVLVVKLLLYIGVIHVGVWVKIVDDYYWCLNVNTRKLLVSRYFLLCDY